MFMRYRGGGPGHHGTQWVAKDLQEAREDIEDVTDWEASEEDREREEQSDNDWDQLVHYLSESDESEPEED